MLSCQSHCNSFQSDTQLITSGPIAFNLPVCLLAILIFSILRLHDCIASHTTVIFHTACPPKSNAFCIIEYLMDYSNTWIVIHHTLSSTQNAKHTLSHIWWNPIHNYHCLHIIENLMSVISHPLLPVTHCCSHWMPNLNYRISDGLQITKICLYNITTNLMHCYVPQSSYTQIPHIWCIVISHHPDWPSDDSRQIAPGRPFNPASLIHRPLYRITDVFTHCTFTHTVVHTK